MYQFETYYTDSVAYNQTANNICITQEPRDICVSLGTYININTKVYSDQPAYLSFQWYNEYGIPLCNKNDSNLYIGPLEQRHFGFYRLRISDYSTNDCLLTRWVQIARNEIVTPPHCYQYSHPNKAKPRQLTQLKGGRYSTGDTVELSAFFQNATSYKWYKDGEELHGCNCNGLIIPNASRRHSGSYALWALNEECGLTKTCETIIFVD